MLFIWLLIVSTMAIAGSAAFFSVYGLATTFSAKFWPVVFMGASLEAGKLVAASYLYRYWTKMGSWGLLLKSYLIIGVILLMFITSMGIFGYLSSGYQADILPLKQKEAQVKLLDEEKARKLARKQQIDDLIAKAPTIQNLERNDKIDNNATRALRESTRARESLTKQYKVEQREVTQRVNAIDAEILLLRQDIIKSEAHVGPITYIAKAFGYDTDQATKYLIFIIIFAFDPLAVALTLAVNIAIRIREEENAAKRVVEIKEPEPAPPIPTPWVKPEPISPDFFFPDWAKRGEFPPEEKPDFEYEHNEKPAPEKEPEPIVQEEVPQPEPEPAIVAPMEDKQPPPPVQRPRILFQPDNVRIGGSALTELINYYREVRERPVPHTPEDKADMARIEDILRTHGLVVYLQE